MKLHTNKSFKISLKSWVLATSFALSILFSTVTYAQEANSLLWKIEGRELKEPSYLYGTIHAICKDDFFVTETVKKALEATEQTVMELDMDDPQMMTNMQQGAVNKGMANISAEFTDEQKVIVNTFFKANYGADLSQLGIMKPFSLMSMVILKSLPCEEIESYEMTFVQNAQERAVEVLGLETVAFQTSLFDNEPMTSQVKMLVSSISELDESKEEFRKMVAAYKRQDINALKQLMTDSPQYAEFEDLLINDRNADWISKIEQFAKDKPTFFAVGALHLPGEKGVIELLKKEGYQVSPVK